MGEPKTIEANADYEDECPTCKAKIIFDLEAGSVFHALPTCDDFDKRDAIEYARFCREEKEKLQVKLEAAVDLENQGHIGFKRRDVPIFHTIVRAPQGAKFTLDGHFDKCDICKAHGVTLSHFNAFMLLNQFEN